MSESVDKEEEVVVPEGSDVYVIDSSRSEATFEIDEVLNGSPFRVVGTTNSVSGSITVNEDDLAASSVSAIHINARTLKTDSDRRDGMIGRMILKSEENEFITFTPTAVTGLPSDVEIGQEYEFTVTGTLSIAGTSKEVSFDVVGKVDSETELSGTAKATILYADFGISIPKVPMVASVEDEVYLTLSFVAVKS